ncbi:hypothetical protein H5410_025123 [Solanum commersonii]|uniref:Uncharacterized protein n=1 Tax=Solanum commersonii TaxID=4109 RepID=A0A9J5YV24_SOLCO|nr:hypothetical protein H5410_025123 [Solanum commersonii]
MYSMAIPSQINSSLHHLRLNRNSTCSESVKSTIYLYIEAMKFKYHEEFPSAFGKCRALADECFPASLGEQR